MGATFLTLRLFIGLGHSCSRIVSPWARQNAVRPTAVSYLTGLLEIVRSYSPPLDEHELALPVDLAIRHQSLALYRVSCDADKWPVHRCSLVNMNMLHSLRAPQP